MVTENDNDDTQNVNFQQPLILCGVKEGKYPDNKPMGYPFDRKIDECDLQNITNTYMKDVVIYHKKDVSDTYEKYNNTQ